MSQKPLLANNAAAKATIATVCEPFAGPVKTLLRHGYRTLLALAIAMPLQALGETSGNPVVSLQTSAGDIRIELYPDKAPATVANFLRYVDSGFFDGTIFHRVIPGFVIQGGGFDPAMTKKPTAAPVKNESTNGLRNAKGTLSMARLSDPDSATSQFFINLKDNRDLDAAPGRPGYAVFARVTAGMEVVEAIARQQTHSVGQFSDVPVEPIIVERAKRLTSAAP